MQKSSVNFVADVGIDKTNQQIFIVYGKFQGLPVPETQRNPHGILNPPVKLAFRIQSKTSGKSSVSRHDATLFAETSDGNTNSLTTCRQKFLLLYFLT